MNKEEIEEVAGVLCGLCFAHYPVHRYCPDPSSWPRDYVWVHFVTGVEQYIEPDRLPAKQTRIVPGLKPTELPCKAASIREHFERRALKDSSVSSSI